MDPLNQAASQKIQAALEHLKKEFIAIRAGRANPSLIEEVSVNAYGAQMKLMELGTISAPQPSLLTIQVWDVGMVHDIVKALQEANLGLNPSTEGQVVRLPIPPLTAERREEFIKLSHQKMEQARIELRQIRQEIREEWKKQQETDGLSDDELERMGKILQETLDNAMANIEQLGKQKEEELRQI